MIKRQQIESEKSNLLVTLNYWSTSARVIGKQALLMGVPLSAIDQDLRYRVLHM